MVQFESGRAWIGVRSRPGRSGREAPLANRVVSAGICGHPARARQGEPEPGRNSGAPGRPGPDVTTTAVSLYLGHPGYAKAVHAHRTATSDTTPLAVRDTGLIKTSDEVIAIAQWVATAAAQRAVTLYTSLPFHVVPLLAALLKHEIGRVTLMEWDLAAGVYRACPLPA